MFLKQSFNSRFARTSLAPRQSTADTVGMLTGVFLSLLFCFWFGHGRIFWEDEMLGWMLLHDPSWRHFIAAWKAGADGGGFAFYLLGRTWFALLSASNLSFRLISASCFALAFCATWQAARRYFASMPTAVALFTTWFLCPPMVMHMVEGRFYGLLVLATALAAWLALVLCDTPVPQPRLYIAAFVVNALLTTTHTLGVMYSGFLLAAIFAYDITRHRFRPFLYASAASSWILLWPERQALRASADVGKPWFWTYPPDFIRFVGAFCGFSNAILFISLVLLTLFIYTAHKNDTSMLRLIGGAFCTRTPVYFVAGSLFCVPLVLGVQAHIYGTSLFINRYLLPVNIALAFTLAETMSLIRWDVIAARYHWFPVKGRDRREAIGAFAAILLLWNVIHVQPYTLGSLDYTKKMTAVMPKGIPVVFQDAWGFTEMIGTQHGSGVQYTYILDWPHSIDPNAPRLEVTQYHLMQNWKQVGYFSDAITYRDEFIYKHPRFLLLKRVIDAKDRNGIIIGNPMVERFAHTPGAQITRLRSNLFGYSIWLVCTKDCT